MGTSRLLLDESPLQVLPSLATVVGLNEAIILQQLHYWTTNRKDEPKAQRDGQTWVYNSYPEWQKQFPWWSVVTIKRTITELEKRGIVVSANHNALAMDKTKWYRIDYDRLNGLLADAPTTGAERPDDGINMTPRGDQSDPSNTRDYQQETSNRTSSLRSDAGEDRSPTRSRDETAFVSDVNAAASQPAPTGSASDRGTPFPPFRAAPLPQDKAREGPSRGPDGDEPPAAPAGPAKPSQAHYRAVLDHIRGVQHIEKEWANFPAQMRAVKQLFGAGYSVEELTVMADVMARDRFWREKGFSAINMASQAHRYAAKVEAELDEPPMTAFEVKEEERRRTLEMARQYDREHPRD